MMNAPLQLHQPQQDVHHLLQPTSSLQKSGSSYYLEDEARTRPFVCTVCSATYKTRTHLRRHMFVHLTSRPYPCSDCGKGFNRKEHLTKHIEAVHSQTKYECSYCGKEISRKDHLNRHIKNMHSSMCAINGNNNSGGTVNGMVSIGGGAHNAKKASLSFLTPNGQLQHHPIHMNNKGKSKQGSPHSKLMKQQIAAQSLHHHQQLQLQQQSNNQPGGVNNNDLKMNPSLMNKKMLFQVFNCTDCNSTFTTEKDFNIHSRTHKPQPYKCAECPRAYTRREKLTEHIRCFHQGQKFSCDYCHKSLSRKDHVLRHVRSVHPEVLANRFVTMAEDMDTQRILNYPASSSSSSSTTATAHQSAAALGEMNILLRSVCHICLKVFGTSYHLSRHMESCHNGDLRPYNCTACSKQFKRKDHLTKHMKQHCPSFKKMNEMESTGIDPIDSLQILMASPDDDLQHNTQKNNNMNLNDIFHSANNNNGSGGGGGSSTGGSSNNNATGNSSSNSEKPKSEPSSNNHTLQVWS